MAIDMIENNELGTFTEGRLGLNQFVDEGYTNYTGGEDFFNLFGSKKRKKRREEEAKVVEAQKQEEIKAAQNVNSTSASGSQPAKNNKNLLLYAGLGVAGILVIAIIIKNR